MIPRSLVHSLLLAVLLFAQPAQADIALQQTAVIGFPVDGVVDVAQIEPGGAGAHRLAVLTQMYLLGLQWSAERKAYDQTFFVQLGGNPTFPYMVLADANGDGRDDIVVFPTFSTDTAKAYDADSGALLRTLTFSGNGSSFIAQNVDGLRGNEIVMLSQGGVSAYKAGVQLWHTDLADLRKIVPPSPGAAAGQEIFVAAQGTVIVLDARTGKERRRFTDNCNPAIVGRASDGNPRLLCTDSSLHGQQFIDANSGASLWSQTYSMFNGTPYFAMSDLDGDGTEDVIERYELNTYVEDVRVFSGRTGEKLGESKILSYSGPVLAVKDGCQRPFILAIEGTTSSFPDVLWTFDASTLAPIGSYAFGAFGTSGVAIDDFDGDGLNEVAVTANGGVTTLHLEPRVAGATATGVVDSCCSFRGMASARVDAQAPPAAFIAGTCGAYLGCVKALNAPNLDERWKGTTDNGEVPNSVAVGDLDGDGIPDVASMTVAVHSGAKGNFVYAYRGTDGKQLWRSINIPASTGRVRIADVEGTGTPQVLALSSSVGITRLTSKGTVSGFHEFTGGNTFTTYTVPGDARAKILIAAGKRLFVLDGGAVKADVQDITGGVSDIVVADIDGDGVQEVLLALIDSNTIIRLQVRSLDKLAVLWTSEPLLLGTYTYGTVEGLAVGDVDNDGVNEVALLASLTLNVFKAKSSSATTPPQFASNALLHARADAPMQPCCTSVLLQWDAARPGSAPPLRYRVYRANTHGGSDVLIATTTRNEFVDTYAGGVDAYRYSVEVLDANGKRTPGQLTTTVNVGGSHCRRTAGK